MSHTYRAVSWTRHKKIYDLILALLVITYVAIFVAVGLTRDPEATIETQLIRALGTCAFLMLHGILSIGPLSRLDDRFLPLLFNRRHLGVSMFLVALAHGIFSIVQFHALGVRNPLVSVLVSNGSYDSLSQFPFQPLGLLALAILFLMAATSHDYWLANLSAPTWKRLHMAVYLAYGLLVLHVALGTLQAERAVLPTIALAAGVLWLVALHLAAGLKERSFDNRQPSPSSTPEATGYVEAFPWYEIPADRARILTVCGERVAVFRHGDQGEKISAISNVCQHQNGPLGEGKVVDGCITCPWHGFQYEPQSGASPPPFTEKVPTFDVVLVEDLVLVSQVPNAPGTEARQAIVSEERLRARMGREAQEDSEAEESSDFYIGYLPQLPARFRTLTRSVVALLTALAVGVAAMIASSQRPADQGSFDFGNTREFSGTLNSTPYPVLHTDSGSRILVGVGKQGADALLDRLELTSGDSVRLAGTTVESEAARMLELIEGEATPGPGSADEAVSLGAFELQGEIVDSKCYLGVMKPGRGKPHRACAALCIEGGIPPALLVQTHEPEPKRLILLLTGLEGEAIGASLLPWVAEPVRMSGDVSRRGDLLYLSIDPAEVEPL